MQTMGIMARVKLCVYLGFKGFNCSQDHVPLRRVAQSEGSCWTADLLDAFLRSPSALVPGTTMGFDGFETEQDRAALLDYLATLD